jgi:hypothetical protein
VVGKLSWDDTSRWKRASWREEWMKADGGRVAIVS